MKVLVDVSNLIMAPYLGKYKQNMLEGFLVEDLENLTRHSTLTSLFKYVDMFDVKYEDIILCFDSPNCWRNDQFEYYKWKRKNSKKESEIDYKKMYEFIETFYNELNDLMPFSCVKVDKCEADDIIAELSRKLTGKIVIITRDKDMLQLKKENVMIYDPFTEKWKDTFKDKTIEFPIKNESDAKKMLLYQILRGDDTDGVPNLKSDSDCFCNPLKKQERFGPQAIYKLCFSEDSDLNKENAKKLHNDFNKNWKRNQTMVDMSKTPKEIKTEINNVYGNQNNIEFDKESTINYCDEHNLFSLKETVEKIDKSESLF